MVKTACCNNHGKRAVLSKKALLRGREYCSEKKRDTKKASNGYMS